MRFCPRCGLLFQEGHRICPLDGERLVPRLDPFLGRIVAGKYRIVDLIGEGGMGRVYRARHVHMDRRVAVKMLPEEASADAEVKARFIREARAADLVRHENIVEIFDVGATHEGVPYMIMELLEGASLDQRIRRGRILVADAVNVLRQICSVLGPMHAMGIIHRDIKPDNIVLVERHGSGEFVKILDFGVAHLSHEPGITREGLVLGTPHYMAPELSMGGRPGPASDLYALGCIAYELLAGHPPFYRGSPFEIMTAQIKSPPPPLPDSPEPLARIVMRLLEKEPSDRYDDAYAVRRDLDAFLPPPRAPRGDKSLRLSTPGFVPGEKPDLPTPTLTPDMLRSWKEFAEAASRRALPRQARSVYELEEQIGKLESIFGTMQSVLLVLDAGEQGLRRAGRHIRYRIDRLADEASRHREKLARSPGDEPAARGLAEAEARIADLRADLGAVIAEAARQLEDNQARMRSLESEREAIEARLCELTMAIGAPLDSGPAVS